MDILSSRNKLREDQWKYTHCGYTIRPEGIYSGMNILTNRNILQNEYTYQQDFTLVLIC